MGELGFHDWHLLLNDLPKSPSSDCSYFEDRKSQVHYFFSDANIPVELQEVAINEGFRRCGDTWYRTACPGCNLCMSYRLRLSDFKPSKNLKTVMRRNRDVESIITDPQPTDEKAEIYLRYQYSQHFLRPAVMRENDFDEDESLSVMYYQMYTNPITSRELEMRVNGKLVGFGIMDAAVTTTSLVYFVFDPELRKRSLGTLNILHSIQWSADEGFEYLNLGYYIPGHMKMDYKARFRPAEIYHRDSNTWKGEMPPLQQPKDSEEPC